MSEPTTDDLKRLVPLAKTAFKIGAVVLPLVVALVTWGETKAKTTAQIDALERRVKELEDATKEDRRELNQNLVLVRQAIADVEREVARLSGQRRDK